MSSHPHWCVQQHSDGVHLSAEVILPNGDGFLAVYLVQEPPGPVELDISTFASQRERHERAEWIAVDANAVQPLAYVLNTIAREAAS